MADVERSDVVTLDVSSLLSQLIVRNIPVSTDEVAYCEAVVLPKVDYIKEPLEEHGHFNRFSPLRCWKFRWSDISMWYAPSHLKGDRGFILGVVSRDEGPRRYMNHAALAFADESFRSDGGVVLAAVSQNGLALEFADARFRSDHDVVLTAVTQNG